MGEDLLKRLSSGLSGMGEGAYVRRQVGGKRAYRTSLHRAVAEILDGAGAKAEEGVRVPGTRLVADFAVNGRYIFVDRDLDQAEVKQLGKLRARCLAVTSSRLRSDVEDAGIRVARVGEGPGGHLQTIFLDDPSFNFDYSHILPHTQKCSVMHGHTSSVLVEVVGKPENGMVVDFGVAKEVIRDAVRALDHKLFISSKYIEREDGASVTLRFRTVHGDFAIQAPKGTTVLLDGEATVENLAKEVLSLVAPRMPANVTAVGVYVYEGMNKGSHLLAQVSRNGGAAARKKR